MGTMAPFVPTLTLIALLVAPSRALYLEVFHPTVWKVLEDLPHNLTMSLRLNASDPAPGSLDLDSTLLEVRVQLDEDWKLDFDNNNTVQFSLRDVLEARNETLTFWGYYWGRSSVSFILTRNDLDPSFANGTLLRNDLTIIVDRSKQSLDMAIITCGAVFMLFNNINMGAQLDLAIIIGVLKRPLGPLCGFISQFICMPVVSFLLGWCFLADPLHRLGLFTLGCCPGGTMSNFWTLMFNGDINLSITMTAVSTLAAMGMMPLWMFTMGDKLLSENENLHIPFANLAGSLVSLTLPIALGIFIKHRRPSWAVKGRRIIKPFTLCIILFFMSSAIFNSYKAFLMMTWQMPLSGMLVAACGYGFGATFAILWCLPKEQVIAISIETAFQNAGVAFILLKLSLPSPDGDLAALPVVATLIMTGPPLMVLLAICTVARRCCGTPEPTTSPSANSGPTSQAFLSSAGQQEMEEEGKVGEARLNGRHYSIELEGLTKKQLMGQLKTSQ